MIATRLHVKRHSTSTLHRPRLSTIRHDSHVDEFLTCPIINIESDISDEFDETTQVEKKCYFHPSLRQEKKICFLIANGFGRHQTRERKELLIEHADRLRNICFPLTL